MSARARTAQSGILRVPRRGALVAIAVLVAAASVVSFAESYRGLYDWAREHSLTGPWAVIWPLQVDVFIAVGELALFVALADAWARRSRIGAWAVTLAGLAVSVAGNVGHVTGHTVADRATAAVPPLAAAAALAVGLGVLKRVVEAHHAAVPAVESVPVPYPAGPAAEDSQVPDASQDRLTEWLVTGHDPVLNEPALNGCAHPGSAHQPLTESTRRAPPAGATENGSKALTNRSRTRSHDRSPKRSRSAPVTGEAAEHEFMSELASGAVPSLRAIRARMHVGPDRAKTLKEHLVSVSTAAVSAGAQQSGAPE